MFLQRDSQFKAAAAAFKRSAELNPGDADAVGAQAQALLSADELEEAARVAGIAVAMECAAGPLSAALRPFRPVLHTHNECCCGSQVSPFFL